MKSSYLLSSAMLAALLAASCGNDSAILSGPEVSESTVTFTLHTPGCEKVIYSSRADGQIHDEEEFAITSLALYEYEVADDGSTALKRIMKTDGNGNNALKPVTNADLGYTFSIIVPAENDGKKFRYKFVANDVTADPELESSFDSFATRKATRTLTDGCTADFFATQGITMTGVAKSNGSEDIIMNKGVQCVVNLQRIVSRIDIAYETPNLMVKNVTLSGAPANSTLFAGELPAPAANECLNLGLNVNTKLPDDFLENLDDDKVELKKAFYVYERKNSEESCMTIHIEYQVFANGLDSYTGAIDVPFNTKTDKSGDYVDALRNNLYTIVLGNGKDPITGKVSAAIVVKEWTSAEIDEPLTDEDDKVIE